MRRTLTVAAAAAAATLLLPGGPLPVTAADSAQAAASRWTAREAAAFWTPERMASALPVPDPVLDPVTLPDTAPAPLPATPAPGSAAPGSAAADPAAAVPPPGGPAAGGPVTGSRPAAVPTPGGPAAAVPAPDGPAAAVPPAAVPPSDSAATPTPAADPATPAAPVPTAPVSTPTAPAGAATPGTPAAPATPAAPTATPEPAPTPSPDIPLPSPTTPTRAPAWPVVAPATAGVGQDFDGIPAVGRMYVMKGGGAYFCSASAVSSPGRNMVISAGHCLLGSDARQVAFVPRYTRAKPQPYGMFPVLRDAAGHAKVWIDQRYKTQGAEKAATLDVAFAAVGPNAAGVRLENAVGGNRLVTGATYTHAKVTLIGHPASASRPRVCVNRTTKFTSKDPNSPGSFLRIDCTGFPGGTSGGPFIARYDGKTRTGDVVGVIGGWKTGGPTADTSYSAYFGAEIRKLYQAAVAGAKGV